jgi:hypothetical protein
MKKMKSSPVADSHTPDADADKEAAAGAETAVAAKRSVLLDSQQQLKTTVVAVVVDVH